MNLTRQLLLAVVLAFFTESSLLGVEEVFETLKVGTNLYAKVTVLNKTRTDLFVSHSKGMGNIKVKDLEPATQVLLGYQLEQPRQSKIEQIWQTTAIPQLESDPRVQQVEAMLSGEVAEAIEELDEQVAFAIVGGFTLVYLLFCFFCRLICLKTGNPPSPLIWLPLLKQIPLFKAAGMSPWWTLTTFVPVIGLIAYIVWCFKITHARGKHVFVGILLLLPVTNLFAFLYLAFADSRNPKDAVNRNVISLRPSLPRQAA